MTVTRKALSVPSNSKSPGSTHHVSIDGQRFEAAAEDRGTGIARCDMPAGPAKITVAAGFVAGKYKTVERREAVVDVIVTGDQADSVTVTVQQSQKYTVQFWGVRAA